MTKFVVLVSLAMTMPGCTSLAENVQIKALTKYVGWFYGQCLVIKAPNLAKGMVVTLVDAEAPENSLRSKIIAPAKNADECSPLAEDRKSVNAEGGKSFYLVSKPKATQASWRFLCSRSRFLARENASTAPQRRICPKATFHLNRRRRAPSGTILTRISRLFRA